MSIFALTQSSYRVVFDYGKRVGEDPPETVVTNYYV